MNHERCQSGRVLRLSEFAYGRCATRPDSEQIEQYCGKATFAKLCELGANSRQRAGAILLSGSDENAIGHRKFQIISIGKISRSSEFADGRRETSPDSEQIEQYCGKATFAKLCELGANSRQRAGAILYIMLIL